MLRKIISVIVLFAAVCTAVSAHTAVIESGGDNKYKAVRLTPEVYNNANGNLSDLRLRDENGEDVPYFINASYNSVYTENDSYPMSLIDSYVKDDCFYFDYKLTGQLNKDALATSINVATNSTDFTKSVELFGSFDNIHWDRVQDDKLYKVDDKAKLGITFNTPQKYTHYRFKLGNNLERIAFTSVELQYSAETTQKNYFVESLIPTFTVKEEDSITHINITGLQNLRLAEIAIDTDSMFQRNVAALSLGANKELYNLTFNDSVYNDTAMYFDGQMIIDDSLELTVRNGDDKPIDIRGISVKYYAAELVFDGSGGGAYTLYFDADSTVSAPVYDIARYKDEILKGGVDRLEIIGVSFGEPTAERNQYDFKTVFNVVVIIVAVILGLLILLKLKKSN